MAAGTDRSARRRDAAVALLTALFIVLALFVWRAVLFGRGGFAGRTVWDWLDLLVLPAALAFGGTVFAVYFTRHIEAAQRRTDLTIEIANGYLARFDDFQESYRALRPGASPEQGDDHLLRKTGNWLEFVALLLNRSEVDERLLQDLGIEQVVCDFYERVQTSPLAQPNLSYWNEMRRYCAGRERDGNG